MPSIEHEERPVVEPKPKAPRGAPKWETITRERVRSQVKRLVKPIGDLVARDANEGDTRLVVTDILTDGLGFDKYSDLTTEYLVKGEFADYGLRVDQQLVAFLETKRATTKLSTKHLRQVEMYALNEGVEWIILTNGARWQVYHVGVAPGLPVLVELALEVDLTGPESVNQKADGLFYITKEAFKRHLIDDVWKEKVARSPRSLASVILSDSVVETIRKELRRRTGRQVDAAAVAKLIRESVVRPECLDE
jgi:predicted type IV restriction endonuclease